MSDVPAEIWLNILSRLSVAPLLRLRCVSKSWKSLIESDEFIKHHLNHSRNTNSSLDIILISCYLYSADFDLLNETNRATFKNLTHPLKAPIDGTLLLLELLGFCHLFRKQFLRKQTQILGSCDGLLALRNDEDDDTILWNPSIRRLHEVPYSRIECRRTEYIVYGFGYDVLSDDYKFVRMVHYYGDLKGNIAIEVKVYSLKSNSWRRVPDFPYYLKDKGTHGEFANGALHWIVTRNVNSNTDSDSLVAAFDLGTEEYRLVPLPEITGYNVRMNVVAALGGCLSLTCNYYKDRVDIWVMKEYRVQESWSILFTFDIRGFDCMMPLAYSKCGRKVLLGLDNQVLMWYDLDKKSTDVLMLQMPVEKSYDMYTCLQSLVLLNKGTCDFDFVTKKKQERNDKLAKTGERVLPAIGCSYGKS